MKVKFYSISSVDDALIQFAVIVSRTEGGWVFCKHKQRNTYELPGGHRDYTADGTGFCETPEETADRELREETGALSYDIWPVCIYSVVRQDEAGKESESFGLLAYSEIREFGEINSEIEKIRLFDELPEGDILTYPGIQPFLYKRIRKMLAARERLRYIRVVIADLDRTLLHTDKVLSDYTAAVLRRLRETGIKVVFATARPMRTVKAYLEQVPCDAVIYHNGAFAVSGGTRIGESYLVDREKAARLLERLNRECPEKKLSLEINDTLYANFDVKEFWSYTDAVETDFTDLPNLDADKLLIEISGEEEFGKMEAMLWEEVYAQMSDGKLCLVMNQNATKLNALRHLSEYWKIPLRDMIAFGDDINDLEMLSGCGIGAAVGNAGDEAREAADLLVGSNDEDGVARFLEQYITA